MVTAKVQTPWMIVTHRDLEVSSAVNGSWEWTRPSLSSWSLGDTCSTFSSRQLSGFGVNQQLLPEGQSKLILHVIKSAERCEILICFPQTFSPCTQWNNSHFDLWLDIIECLIPDAVTPHTFHLERPSYWKVVLFAKGERNREVWGEIMICCSYRRKEENEILS